MTSPAVKSVDRWAPGAIRWWHGHQFARLGVGPSHEQRGCGLVDVELIRGQWDQMLRLAASL